MSGIAELQTVAAVFDLLKVTYQAGKFFKKVRDADKIALELGDRISRLSHVLDGVNAILRARDESEISSENPLDAQVTERIRETVIACSEVLEKLRKRLGGFHVPEQSEGSKSFSDRIKVAIRQPSILRISHDLEARIHILSTDLSVLQLFAQTQAHQTIDSNHKELLDILTNLGAQVSEGSRLLKQFHQETSLLRERKASGTSTSDGLDDPNRDAIQSLAECMRNAEDIHDHYTSEYQPDNRSVFLKDRDAKEEVPSPHDNETPSIHGSPRSPSPASRNVPSIEYPVSEQDLEDGSSEEGEDVWPLQILNMHISGYVERANREREMEHFNQAEHNLQQAIKYSELRETHYDVPFTARVRMQEETAMLFQKQQKWAEAVSLMHQLLRERSPSNASEISTADDDLEVARQNQLLASIYYDRHLLNAGTPLSLTAADVAKAETHARRAFNKRWKSTGSEEREEDEAEKQACIQLLVKILETRDKTVESNELRKLLTDGSSVASESVRRVSTNRQPTECDVFDKHEMLISAIKTGDFDQIESLLAAKDLELERLCRDGKTPLMHAVEVSDEFTVHKLLDPAIGANIETKNRRGLTALHIAAEKSHEMVKCLLHHDAEIEPKDRYEQTPIMKAVKAGNEESVQVLFEARPSTIETRSSDEWSVLHHAVHSAFLKMTEFLLDICPDLKDAVDRAGKTALHHCAENQRLEQASVLLQHKNALDVDATDSVSRTPLYLAATRSATAERVKMVDLLVKHGAVINPEKPPPRARDYPSLVKQRVPRRDSAMSRTSVSTSGTVGTNTTGLSRFSRALGGRMGLR